MARARGIKQRHPLGSVASRAGVSALSAVPPIITTTSGVKISELPGANAANDTDQLEVNQAGTSRSITLDQLSTLVADSDAVHDQMGLVNAKWHGAVGDGVTDDTAAIQTALDTGHAVFLPKGDYLVTNMLTVPYGSGLFGETKYFSRIIVPVTFNLSALGVIRIAAETGARPNDSQAATVQGISIEFNQPDTAVRASLVQYPPAIYAASSPRIVIQNVRIVRAWKGLWMPGNAGGVMVDNLEASCFNQAVWMDDIFDLVHFSRIHLWYFGLTTNQSNVWGDGTTIGLEAGRVDGLHITDFFAISMPKAIWIHSGSGSAVSVGNMTNVMLDDAGMVIANGIWTVSSLTMNPGPVTARTLIVTPDSGLGAQVTIAALAQRVLSLHSSGAAETILVSNGGGGIASVNISGMMSESFAYDRTHVALNGGRLNITNGHFIRDGGTTATKPTIRIITGRAALSNISTTDKGSGTGDLIKIDADDWISMSKVSSLGWTIAVPANAHTINHDCYDLIQTYTPTVTSAAGTITSYTATGRYTWNGRFLKLQVQINIATNGTASGEIIFTTPAGFVAAAYYMISGKEYTTNLAILQAGIAVGSTQFHVTKYDNTYPAGNGATLIVDGEIEGY